MQEDRLVFELILNIALLVLIANLISKLRLIQDLILQERRSFWQRRRGISYLWR